MQTLRNSVFIILLCVPTVVLADSRVEVPTTIQVIDASGRTTVSTDTPQISREPRPTPFAVPPECDSILETPQTRTPTTPIPSQHPLWARIESQRAALLSLIAQLSFAPELSPTQELKIKDVLPEFGAGIVSTTTSISCLSLLDKAIRERGGVDQRSLIDALSKVAGGLQYGLRSLSIEKDEVPKSALEALYAGDILLSQHPAITSLSINPESVRMNIVLPVHLFWGKNATATVAIVSDEQTVTLNAPWWIIFGTHALSGTKSRLFDLSPQQRSLEGLYLRAKAIADSLPS